MEKTNLDKRKTKNIKIKKSGTKPWLNKDGSKKSDKEISELGKGWSTKQWSEYLNYDLGEIKDDLSFFGDMDTSKVYERAEILKYLQECEYHESIEIALLLGMVSLSRIEREILKYSFWRMMSDREIAKKLKTSYGSIRSNKSVAIKKLAKILSSATFKKKIKIIKKTNKSNNAIKKQKQWLNAG